MTPEKMREIIETYRAYFIQEKIGKTDYPHEYILDNGIHGLEHCHGMLDQMIRFIDEGRMDKVNRWIGFIQGVLWADSIFPLAALKTHNRPS